MTEKQQALTEFEQCCVTCLFRLCQGNRDDLTDLFHGISGAARDVREVRENLGVKGIRLTGKEWVSIGKFLFLVYSLEGGPEIVKRILPLMDEAAASIVLMMVSALNAACHGVSEQELAQIASRVLASLSKGPEEVV